MSQWYVQVWQSLQHPIVFSGCWEAKYLQTQQKYHHLAVVHQLQHRLSSYPPQYGLRHLRRAGNLYRADCLFAYWECLQQIEQLPSLPDFQLQQRV